MNVGDRVRVKDGVVLNDLWEPYRDKIIGTVTGASKYDDVADGLLVVLLDSSPWNDNYREVHMKASNLEVFDDHV